MTTQPDWRHAIVQHAATAGVHLQENTIEELAAHLEEVHAAALRHGLTAEEALAAANAALRASTMEALRDYGTTQAKASGAAHATIPASGRNLNVRDALRLAMRRLRQNPGFAAITVLVLALGIGTSTTVFSIVDSVLLRPLPYREPDRLVRLWDSNSSKGLMHEPVSAINFMDYRELAVFNDAAAWSRSSVRLVDPGLEPLRVNAVFTSGNLFGVLGVRPQIGNGFPADRAFSTRNEALVVISDRLWRSRFEADTSIVGRPIRLNDVPSTVAGVMPPGFQYPGDVDVWQLSTWDFRPQARGARFLEAIARLADGVSQEHAAAATAQLGQRLETEFESTNKGWAPRLIPLLEDQLGYYRPALFVLVGAVGLVLIIACINVASLLLTRALGREREIALRVALGALPRHLLAQLLAESFVLSAAGALLGVLMAITALPALVAMAPAGIARLGEAHIDVRALGLAAALVVSTTVVFGLLPALVLLRQRPVELRSGERGSARRVRRVYSLLVAGQMALACTLLVSSALLVRTVRNMVTTPIGVDADPVVTATIQLPGEIRQNDLSKWQTVAQTQAALLERIRQQPGIMAAGATNTLPLESGWRFPFVIDGEQAAVRSDDRPQAQYHTVTDGYFETMGATLTRGRWLSPFDTDATPGVVVVNESFVTKYLHTEQSPIGRVVVSTQFAVGPLGRNLLISIPAPQGQPPSSAHVEIVGVIKDVRNVPLGQPVEPAIYFSGQQFPFREMIFAVRASSTTAGVAAVRAALAAVLPRVPMGTVRTWTERMAAHTAEPRLLMVLLVFFSLTAGLLAALGIYGLFSWSVSQRTRELAIRLALGASPASVGARVAREGLTLTIVGLVTGFALVRGAQGALSRVLFEVSPGDAGSSLTASMFLVLVAMGACALPVLRAVRVDPVEGLRVE